MDTQSETNNPFHIDELVLLGLCMIEESGLVGGYYVRNIAVHSDTMKYAEWGSLRKENLLVYNILLML